MFNFEEISKRIYDILNEKGKVIIAIDGDCASGKSTLAEILKEKFDANIIHSDDFFLPLELRNEERLLIPGGNIYFERLKSEVIDNLENDFAYRPFSCKTMSLMKEVNVSKKDVTIIEGSYSLSPYLGKYYDLSIFLQIESFLQLERLKIRNEKMLEDFINKWIPLEKKYFKAFDIKNKADIVISINK